MESSHHRKIELQSPRDLSHIESQIRALARQKIDQNLPPVAGQEGIQDELRTKVEELVQSYIDSVLSGMRRNVWVNGLDVGEASGQDEIREEFEPFDTRLKDRLEHLTARKNTLVEHVSELRRTAPKRSAQSFQTQFLAETQQFEQAQQQREVEASRLLEQDLDALLKLDQVQRFDEIRRNWEKGMEGLGSLKGGLPETRARLERGVGVVGHLAGK